MRSRLGEGTPVSGLWWRNEMRHKPRQGERGNIIAALLAS
jgi:hypothetical protein